jgi:RNA polymerase sigma-70 factor (ECF subfamily)
VAELPDEIIMESVKGGNISELSVLFDRYHVRLYNFFLKLTFDRAISQDLTQNLFYRIMKYRHTFNRDKSFRSWIYQMARNVHIDYIKQQKRTKDHFQNVEDYDSNTPESGENYSEEEYSRLDRALLKLHPDQLEIIVLSRYQGLNYQEISEISNSTVGAIKVQMHRAIRHLREIYFKLA